MLESRKKHQSQVRSGLQTSPKFLPVGEIMWKLLRQIIPASTAAGSEILGSAPDSIPTVTQPQGPWSSVLSQSSETFSPRGGKCSIRFESKQEVNPEIAQTHTYTYNTNALITTWSGYKSYRQHLPRNQKGNSCKTSLKKKKFKKLFSIFFPVFVI